MSRMSEKTIKLIKNLLNDAATAAKMMGDDESRLRFDRALIALEANPHEDIFDDAFIARYVARNKSIRRRKL